MVKFGKHLEVFAETDDTAGLFVVPYNEIKAKIRHNDTSDDRRSLFEELWRSNLNQASQEFASLTQDFFARIFARIGSQPEARGALPGTAIRLYVLQTMGAQHSEDDGDTSSNNKTTNNEDSTPAAGGNEDAARDLLVRLKQIYEVAYHNTEALRKLVKKYDKHVTASEVPLSPILLPLLYSANITLGQPNLEEGIDLLRHLLLEQGHPSDDEDGGDDSNSVVGYGSVSDKYDQSHHDAIVQDRQAELDWLRRLTESMPPSELHRLVAHRGFHSVHDYSHRRPIENSLTAYEAAWTSGVRICECDIALTKDERLILAHDDNFTRLALNKHHPTSSQKIQDLTFKELMALPLTSASRPPLLLDVLYSAETIGADHAQLVIEIKPGNEAAATALAQLLAQRPEFWPCIAVIMSFDAYTINQLRQELQRSSFALAAAEEASFKKNLSDHTIGHRKAHSRSISFSAGLDTLTLTSSPVLGSKSAVGLSGFSSSPAVFPRKHSLTHLPNSSSSNLLLKPISSRTSGESLWLVGQSPGSQAAVSSLPPKPPSPLTLEGKGEPPSPPPPPPPASSPKTKPTTTPMPKLMLLTVADPPKKPCELRVSVEDLSPVDAWMKSGGEDGAKSLDGVYLQYQPEMLEPAGAAALRQLSQNYAVGVWTFSDQGPDDYETFRKLVHDANVTYVNTDLPETFRASVRKKSSGKVNNNMAGGGGQLYKKSMTR